MRFLRLDLRAFGPFADAPPLLLNGGRHGLHLIQGPNEAGKSSALRAIRCLLFGFPLRSPDDHRHAYKDLRVGATIWSVDGTELSFLRRKGDVRTIRTPDDDGVIAEETLARCLGGIDEGKFNDLFAMDHAELVRGGLDIIQGKGNLGPILFAAGSGLARVDEVRKALEAEVDELFKPRASNPSINAALADLKAERDRAEKAMLATSAWVELDATLARERARKDAIDGQIRAVEAEKRRLERLRDALPVIARRAVALGRLAELGDAPVLADGFADRRREATVDRQVGINAGLAAAKARSTPSTAKSTPSAPATPSWTRPRRSTRSARTWPSTGRPSKAAPPSKAASPARRPRPAPCSRSFAPASRSKGPSRSGSPPV